jgi:hypothetical protein
MLNGDDLALACPRRLSPGHSKILLGTALGFAIAALDGARHRNAAAASDRDDMVALFLRNFPNETHREMLMANVERVLGHAPDMIDWMSVAAGEPQRASGD